jgi:hypothetical protein
VAHDGRGLRQFFFWQQSSTTITNLWALTKGVPEALEPMLGPESLLTDYEQSLGQRVLALAGLSQAGKQHTSHNQVEIFT